MNRLCLPLLGLAALVAPALTGYAQHAVYVEHHGQYRLVRRVVRSDPYVDNGSGKLVAASGTTFGMKKVEEYAPFFVSIRHLKVATRHLSLVNSGAELNHEFDFSGEFETPYYLENVFVVLELETERAGSSLFVREVGDLEPHDSKEIILHLPLNQKLGEGHYKLHVFSNGAEIFHSEMPFGLIERELDKIVRKRIEGVQDARPQPFVGPSPEYPAKLRRNKVSGSATIHFTINPNGRVQEPSIKTASSPEFGEAALVAARQWRFLPKVEHGRAVATAAEMPFAFVPPGAKPPKPQ